MSKIKLEMEYDYDFDLIGISCHAPDYRLCWAINQALGIAMVKMDQSMEMRHKKMETHAQHSIFEFVHEEDHLEYFLIANKNGASLLIPEQKNADYLFLLRNNFVHTVPELIQTLRSIDLVIMAFTIDVESLKSKENLIF